MIYQGTIQIAINTDGTIQDKPVSGDEVIATWTPQGYKPEGDPEELPDWFWKYFDLRKGAIERRK